MHQSTKLKPLSFFIIMSLPFAAVAVDGSGTTPVDPSLEMPPAFFVSPELSGSGSIDVYYLTKAGDAWSFSNSGDLTQKNVERIAVNQESGEIRLLALPPTENSVNNVGNKKNVWECFSGTMPNGFRNHDDYSICSSSFKKNVTNPAMAVIGAANLLFGSLRREVEVDKDALLAAFEGSGRAFIEREREQQRLQRYRDEFASATTSLTWLQAFIDTYENNDPEGLVVKARAALPGVEAAEKANQRRAYRSYFESASTVSDLKRFISEYASDDPDKLVPKAQQNLRVAEAREAKVRQQDEEAHRKEAQIRTERARAAAQELSAWRNQLRPGDDTFCGPVIEIKGPMIKIAVRAQLSGYGNEAWLKSSEMYPDSYNCRNTNGRLTAYE